MTQIDRGPVRIGQWVVSVDLTLTDREASEIRARIIEWLAGPPEPIVLGATAHLCLVLPDAHVVWVCHPDLANHGG
jgi:hypothetical protein